MINKSASKRVIGNTEITFQDLPTDNLKSELMFWWRHVMFNVGCGERSFDQHVQVHEDKLLKLFKNLYVKDTKNKTILDVGCGAIGFIHRLDAKLRFGLDPLIEQISRFVNLAEGTKYINKGIEDLNKNDLGDNRIDVVFSHSSVDHWTNPLKGLTVIYKMLPIGGYLLLPHQTVFLNPTTAKQNLSHTHSFSEEMLVAIIKRSGFKAIKLISPEIKSEEYEVSIVAAKGNVIL